MHSHRLGVGRAFGLSPVAFAVLVLQAGTPVAVTSYLLAEKCNAEAAKVAKVERYLAYSEKCGRLDTAPVDPPPHTEGT